MKKRLLAGLLLAGVAGCAKRADAKPAASLIGTWPLTSQTIVVTPKSGGAATTYPQVVVPNTITLTYAADGTYTYSGNIITYSAIGKTSAARVDVLTANNLTHGATTEDVTGSYTNVTTNTYTR